MRRQLACVAALLCAARSASSQNVAGHWTATFDSDIRAERDTFRVLKRGPATLDLTQRGDSVFGVWRAGTLDTSVVKGTFDGRALKLTSGLAERTIKFNGQATTMKVRTDLSGVVHGSTVVGTLFIYIGDRPPAPRKWEGQRRP